MLRILKMHNGQKKLRSATGVVGGLLMVFGVALPSSAVETSNTNINAQVFTPHRALYQIGLIGTRQGSSVTDAEGTMYYRIEPLCHGWEVETRVTLTLSHDEIGAVEDVKTAWSFNSFENYDGTELSFGVDHLQNGRQAEVFSGASEKKPTGGSAFFDGADLTDVDLPSGTLYPAEHLMRVLESAKNGQQTDLSLVFDGASIDNPYQVNTIILGQVISGKNQSASLADLQGPKTFRGTPASFRVVSEAAAPAANVWRVRMAYFPVSNVGGVPDFELEVDFREDGVAQHMTQDFGDFTLSLIPTSIEILPETPCN